MCNIAQEHGIISEEKKRQIELDPYNKSIITMDKTVHNTKIMKYQTLFVSLLVSKKLAWILHKTGLYKIIPSRSALFLNIIAYMKAWSPYEHEQVRSPKRYISFMMKKVFGV
jgi:hypothetical protein